MTCVVCFYPDGDPTNLPCCSSLICDPCLKQYVNTQLGEGNVKINCPGFQCTKTLNNQVMRRIMTSSMEAKQLVLKINMKKDPTVKLCPRCNLITTRTKKELRRMKRTANVIENPNSLVICDGCVYSWCFYCYAPWHHGATCKGSKSATSRSNLVEEWSKQKTTNRQQRNAFPCPYCGIFIERSGGCPNMTCSRCHTHWCYLCGKQSQLFIPLIGHHDDKYSILGCTSDWKLIRGDLKATKRIRRGIFITQIVLIVLFTVPFMLLIIPFVPAVVILGGTILISVAFHKLLNKLKFHWDTQHY